MNCHELYLCSETLANAPQLNKATCLRLAQAHLWKLKRVLQSLFIPSRMGRQPWHKSHKTSSMPKGYAEMPGRSVKSADVCLDDERSNQTNQSRRGPQGEPRFHIDFVPLRRHGRKHMLDNWYCWQLLAPRPVAHPCDQGATRFLTDTECWSNPFCILSQMWTLRPASINMFCFREQEHNLKIITTPLPPVFSFHQALLSLLPVISRVCVHNAMHFTGRWPRDHA